MLRHKIGHKITLGLPEDLVILPSFPFQNIPKIPVEYSGCVEIIMDRIGLLSNRATGGKQGDWNFLRTLEVDRSACDCQMKMIDLSLIAMRREIRVYSLYLSVLK